MDVEGAYITIDASDLSAFLLMLHLPQTDGKHFPLTIHGDCVRVR